MTNERVIFSTADYGGIGYNISGRKYSNEDSINVKFEKSLENMPVKHDYCFPRQITGKIIISKTRPKNLENDVWYGLRSVKPHFLFSVAGQPIKSEIIDLKTRFLLVNNDTNVWGDLNIPFYTLKPTISDNITNFLGKFLNVLTFQTTYLPLNNISYSKEDYNTGIELIPKIVEDAINIKKALRKEHDSMEIISH